jgi:MFS family permease
MFIDAVGWPLGWMILSVDTVLPAFLLHLTHSPQAVALVRATYAFGVWLPVLWGPRLIARMRRRGWFVASVGLVERIPLLVFAIAAPLLAVAAPRTMLIVFFAGWAVRSLAEGVNIAAYAALLDESVPPQRRGALWGVSSGISAALALPVGVWASGCLAAYPFPVGYTILFFVGFAVLVATVIPLGWVREQVGERLPARDGGWGIGALRRLREDRQLRRYALATAVGGVAQMALPFYIVHTLQALGAPEYHTPLYAGTQAAAAAVGSIAFGLAGDRCGNKRPLMLALTLGLLAPLLASIAKSPAAMFPAFAALGLSMSGSEVCRYNLLLEIPPRGRVAEYVGVSFSMILPVYAVSPVIGARVVEVWGTHAVFAPAAVGLVLAIVLLTRVRDPRRWGRSGAARAASSKVEG